MATSSPSKCSEGGRALPGQSRCRNHTRSNWGRYRPTHAHVYRTNEWKALRDRVLQEQPVCYVEGCIARSTEVDHIIPVYQREDLALARNNVRAVCSPHDRQRSSSQGGEAKRKRFV